MRTYKIAKVRGGGTDWVVVATNEDGSENWLIRHQTEEDAQATALLLTASESAGGDGK